MARSRKQPLFELPHGIEVIGEYPPNENTPYWRVRVRPHPLVPGKEQSGGVLVRRSRAVAASILGRVIGADEHVHHKNEDVTDDRPGNLIVFTPSQHNEHHKTGKSHTEVAKQRIGQSLQRAYAEGRRQKKTTTHHRDTNGRFSK